MHMLQQLKCCMALYVVKVDLAVSYLGVHRVLKGLLFAFEILNQLYLNPYFRKHIICIINFKVGLEHLDVLLSLLRHRRCLFVAQLANCRILGRTHKCVSALVGSSLLGELLLRHLLDVLVVGLDVGVLEKGFGVSFVHGLAH